MALQPAAALAAPSTAPGPAAAPLPKLGTSRAATDKGLAVVVKQALDGNLQAQSQLDKLGS